MKIAITGIGIVSALGFGIAENREHLLAGESHVCTPKILKTIHKEWPIGEICATNQELASRIGIKKILSRNVLIGLIALEEALADAGIIEKIPLINGTTVGGMDLIEQHYNAWKHGDYTHIDLILQHESSFTTAELARHCGLANEATISTACSSALNAIIYGANLLRTKETKQVVVGGTDAMSLFHLNGFASLDILSQKVCRPFQADRDGINLGEGAAYIVLEEATTAEKRGAHIYGYIAGYANRCDAYHQTASSPNGEGAYNAITEALQLANLQPDAIDYVNAHGTATQNNDASEWCALQHIFHHKWPLIESTKSLTGHTTSASGSIEVIFCLIKMQEKGYHYALNNAFGFGGNDSALIISDSPTDLPDLIPITMHESQPISIGADIDYKPYVPAIYSRRMTPVMRQLMVAAKEAMRVAGITEVDGIVVGTQWGGMLPTICLLETLSTEGEHNFSPAQFMNSTHNAAAGTLSRLLQCKGYNTTITSNRNLLAAAKKDAKLALATNAAKCVLVCSFDETDNLWQSFLKKVNYEAKETAKACIVWSN